jgi:hypothetical protein
MTGIPASVKCSARQLFGFDRPALPLNRSRAQPRTQNLAYMKF